MPYAVHCSLDGYVSRAYATENEAQAHLNAIAEHGYCRGSHTIEHKTRFTAKVKDYA